jgi:DNA-binding NarL/FixJ family response regulator
MSSRNFDVHGSVLVADDHEVFRVGLIQLLKQGLGVTNVLQADTFDRALDLLDDTDLAMAIFDLGMPGLSGPQDFASVRDRRPDIRVVVLSASDQRSDILAALEAGVHGYIVKSERTDNLLDRLRYIASGEIYVPPVLAQRVTADRGLHASSASASSQESSLSERQRDVLNLLVQGLSNKEIARALGLSEGTVKMHIAALFRALGASNRAHAAALGKHLLP